MRIPAITTTVDFRRRNAMRTKADLRGCITHVYSCLAHRFSADDIDESFKGVFVRVPLSSNALGAMIRDIEL